ncbi:MAG: SAM-dependent methyltransferase [Clostridiaceae bacterium]|jgi:SAM-dependent methyltransferase|nr:SAM-dependent methyltransferase [Clostridiaceae bacterium]
MNNQNINKLKLFIFGLKNRFNENNNIFEAITIQYKSGLKEFKGSAHLSDDKLQYTFNGKITKVTFDELLQDIINQCSKYDNLTLTYKERGTHIVIVADNKTVTMKNVEVKDLEKINSSSLSEASTLLNRNYLIKIGKADKLLKEIGIMTKDGKIKNDKIRKYNQIDHYVELFNDVIDKLPKNKIINILDCGCGKSYLSFVLNYYLTEVKKTKCHFIGVDYKESVIDTSRKIAQNLDYRNMEFHAADINNYVPNTKINVVISLHACDTATDMALALGIKLNSDAIVAVPCCHRELLDQYSYEPFKNIIKYGALKSRLADVLTDGMRALMLEAKGYDVSVVEYISPLETPKNLMIKAVKTSNNNDAAMNEYINLMSSLNAYPALYDYLQNQ